MYKMHTSSLLPRPLVALAWKRPSLRSACLEAAKIIRLFKNSIFGNDGDAKPHFFYF